MAANQTQPDNDIQTIVAIAQAQAQAIPQIAASRISAVLGSDPV